MPRFGIPTRRCSGISDESSAQGSGGRKGIGVDGGGGGGGFRASGPTMEYTLPFRAYSAANWIALFAQRHFHEYGTTREQLAWIALNARRNNVNASQGVHTWISN